MFVTFQQALEVQRHLNLWRDDVARNPCNAKGRWSSPTGTNAGTAS